MRRLLTAALLLAPLTAFAAPCKFEAPRNLQLDLAGVRAVQIELHSQNLHLTGSEGAKGLTLNGRACASDSATLDHLTVTQRRDGDQLLIDIGGENRFTFNLFGNSYAYLDVNVQLPPSVPVTLSVGSGDAEVSGLQQLQSVVGSGDLHVRQVSGKFGASVGSGDIDAHDIGSLELGSVGSGDFKAEGVRGDAKVGSVGSGDVVLRKIGGAVHADTLGSGDFSVSDVTGDFTLGAKGSGDVNHSGVKGKVSVPKDNDD
jgi:Putative adhesin